MLYVLLVLNLTCLLVFQWGRSGYFRRSASDRIRGGLGPIGTVMAIVQLPLVWSGALRSSMTSAVVVMLLYLAALALFFWAVRSHGDRRPGIAFSSRTPDVLVTRGAYQLARHPFYLAYMLFWAGVAVLAPLYIGLVILIIMAGLYGRAAIEEEEAIMQSPMAVSYAEYKKRVGRFFRWP